MSTQTDWRELILEVRAAVATVVGVDPDGLSRNTSFVDDLGIDARRSAELRRAVEQLFGVELSKADSRELQTLGDLTRFIQAHRTSGPAKGKVQGTRAGSNGRPATKRR